MIDPKLQKILDDGTNDPERIKRFEAEVDAKAMTQREKIEVILHRMAKYYEAAALQRTPPNKTDFTKAITQIETLITEEQMQAVMNFVAQYKIERINHTLSTKADEWKRELDHIEEFHNKFQASLKGKEV